MSKLEITERNGERVRYRLTSDDGVVSHGEIDATDFIEEAKSSKKSLASVMARALSGIMEDSVEPIEAEVFIQASSTTMSVDGEVVEIPPDVKFVLPEHEHPYLAALPEHDHQHEHKLLEHEHKHEHPMQEHRHELEPHGHEALLTRVATLESSVEALLKPHTHQHDHEELHVTARAIAALKELVEELTRQVMGHEHPAVVPDHDHPHDHGKHEHPLKEHEHPHDHEHEHPHEHPAVAHAHPEIVGLFTPEKLRAAADTQKAHLHDYTVNNGDGWRCGVCGMLREAGNG